MGNTHTREIQYIETVFNKSSSPSFLIERILSPRIKVGVVSGRLYSGPDSIINDLDKPSPDPISNQGIRVGNEDIRRLVKFDVVKKPSEDELLYMFEAGVDLRLYKCNPMICYDLKLETGDREVGALHPSIIKLFKPISMGDTSKDIDKIEELFKKYKSDT